MNRWISLTSALGVAMVFGLGASQPARAQLSDPEATVSGIEMRRLRTLTIPEAFERAYFEHNPNFFDNRNLGRQIESMFFSYPENEITRDGELIYVLYRDVLEQQNTYDPYLRTPDLLNPFNSSLDTLYRTGGNPPVRGSEFIIDR
ncbi:MAG: hypothetical protein J7641_16680 [Cyanobacteria bacterium SID2]|nr:hypothetical protein [Cyanobacteria bacterium SID2]MBP0004897.1 hypothetical protein [Cyanobacteria bacterium SBC]